MLAMSSPEKAVDGWITNYNGCNDDGDYKLLPGEIQGLLPTGADLRSAQVAQRDGIVALPTLVRLHELAIFGDSPTARGFLHKAVAESWEIEAAHMKDMGYEDGASLAPRIESLRQLGQCPHAHAAAEVIARTMQQNVQP